MTFTNRGTVVLVSAALLATVATQLFYMGVVYPQDSAILRKITWTSEMVLFSIVAWGAIALAARSRLPLIWSAVAIAGLMNVIQVGVGLQEFPQAEQAADKAVFQTVLNGAFYLYFHGKMMIGLAAAAMGTVVWQGGTVTGKTLGGLSVLAGLAAIGFNIHGMANGMDLVFPAGAAGTAATALFAVTALVFAKED